MKSTLISLFFILLSSSSLSAVNIVETDSYSKILNVVKKEANSDTMVVFDIDDTLLHIPNCLGLSEEGKKSGFFAIAYSCPAFITDDVVYDVFDFLNDNGVDHMALTARNNKMTELTLEQLKTAGIDFYGKPFTSKDDFRQKMTKKTDLTFDGGVSHASGLSKGRMLKYFVDERYERTYKNIIFIDDNFTNIKSLRHSFKNVDELNVTLIYYTFYNH